MELLEKVKEDKIEFASLQFTDLLGVVKEVIIPANKLEDALATGVWFDGSSIEGFARIQESDLFLRPDPNTYAVIPWLDGKTARLICDIFNPDATPFEYDPRFILKRTLEEAKKMGFQYNTGPEPEFYIFRNNSEPIDHGRYFDLATHESYKSINEISAALKSLGIKIEAIHHEVGYGQYEIDFNYASALETADKLLTLKYTIKKIAEMNGFNATFMPKPIMNAPGSGLHVHQSLFDLEGNNLFYDAKDKYRLSKVAYNFIAGQMKHIKALCAVICPTVNSYKRLVSGFEAPVYITWACMNRSALIRVPRWFEEKSRSARIELRCPDPTCNPYLAFAVMLSAGIDGIKNNLIPLDPVEENVYELDSEGLMMKHIDLLPSSLYEALNEMRKSELMKEVLGKQLFDRYISIKSREWDEFRVQVTEWEINKYIDIY